MKADYIAGSTGHTITKLHTHAKFGIFPPLIRSLPTKPHKQKGSCLAIFQAEVGVCPYRDLLQENTNRNNLVE